MSSTATPQPTAGQPVISAYGVHRRYGSTDALAGADLTVRTGEIVALLGPNGAGKTTLIEILEGLRRRDAGTVSVLGVDPAHADRTWRSRIGAVLQLGTETDELTVAEMLGAHASYYPTPCEIDELIDGLQLQGLEGRRVGRLSGGQRRRLDIALGLVGDPELVFLDEPTTGLDAEVRRSIWALIGRLADRGTTVLLTTHYLDEVEQLAARTFVLVGGRTVWSGDTDQLRTEDQPEVVTFSLRPPYEIADLPPVIRPFACDEAGGVVSLSTVDTTDTVGRLLGWARSRPGDSPVLDLQIRRPSIEDAYLELLRTHQHDTAHGVAATKEGATR